MWYCVDASKSVWVVGLCLRRTVSTFVLSSSVLKEVGVPLPAWSKSRRLHTKRYPLFRLFPVRLFILLAFKRPYHRRGRTYGSGCRSSVVWSLSTVVCLRRYLLRLRECLHVQQNLACDKNRAGLRTVQLLINPSLAAPSRHRTERHLWRFYAMALPNPT